MSNLQDALTFGRYTAHVVPAGTFALDGGAMFGIIPRPMWEKRIQADDKHRIDLATNCLLLRDGEKVILVDNGMGDKWSDKHKSIFKVGEQTLVANLAALGVTPHDVTDLVLTHLHFDHAGGTTYIDADGNRRLRFPNANVHVGKRNWEWAKDPVERDRGSYRNENFDLIDDDRLVLHDDEVCLADGGGLVQLFDEVWAYSCDGHTSGQLLPLVGREGGWRLLYGADMIPTHHHVRMPWHMGYDLRPTTLLQEKRALLSLCADENVALMYEHDLDIAVSAIVRDGDDFAVGEAVRRA